MTAPLWVLAGATAAGGFAEKALAGFLAGALPTAPAGTAHHAWLPFAAVGLCGAGILLAWVEFGRRGAAQIGFAERAAPLAALFANRWYIDRAYRWVLDNLVYGVFSALCAKGDQRVIDGAVDGLGGLTARAGRRLSTAHTGMIQYRLIIVFATILLLTLYGLM